MIEAAVCLFLVLFSIAVYGLFYLLKRIYRHRPPSPNEDSLLAALFSPAPAPETSRLQPAGEVARTGKNKAAP